MTAHAGYVLYDGNCRFCIGIISRWRPTLESRGFRPVPLQEPWVRARLADRFSLTDILLLKPDGELLRGVDAYLYAARRIWWARPFAWLFSRPVLRPLADKLYRWIAQNRYCFAGTCELPASNIS